MKGEREDGCVADETKDGWLENKRSDGGEKATKIDGWGW